MRQYCVMRAGWRCLRSLPCEAVIARKCRQMSPHASRNPTIHTKLCARQVFHQFSCGRTEMQASRIASAPSLSPPKKSILQAMSHRARRVHKTKSATRDPVVAKSQAGSTSLTSHETDSAVKLQAAARGKNARKKLDAPEVDDKDTGSIESAVKLQAADAPDVEDTDTDGVDCTSIMCCSRRPRRRSQSLLKARHNATIDVQPERPPITVTTQKVQDEYA